jgi:hypothetical protein
LSTKSPDLKRRLVLPLFEKPIYDHVAHGSAARPAARPMGRTARPSPCPCRHGTKASACHGPPARPMTRHGHDTARGEARWPARLPHPAASPIAMEVAAAAAHPRCDAPSSSSRPRARSQGCRCTSSLWARGRAPPGRRRERRCTRELCPDPASPPPCAPHQSGADAPTPPSPTDATRRRRLLSSALGSTPKPRRRICQTATRSAAGSPCSRAARGTPCSQHDRWPMFRVVGRRFGPWHGQVRHGLHGAARRSAHTAQHGRAACRADTARWPSIDKPFVIFSPSLLPLHLARIFT